MSALPRRKADCPVGTVATLGHPANRILIVKGAGGWRFIETGELVGYDDLAKSQWDIVTMPSLPPAQRRPDWTPDATLRPAAAPCIYCHELVGLIHYGDGDRWQPTPDLGDDFCFDRWDQMVAKPAMFCEESLARESGRFHHSPTEDD